MRRRELFAALGGLAYAAGCGGGSETKPRPRPPRPPPGYLRVARVDELSYDDFASHEVVLPYEELPYEARLLKLHVGLKRRDGDSPEVVAFVDRCTHLGCPVRYVEASRRFICPCHGAIFDSRGRPRGGPAKLPLRPVETRIVEGVVYAAP